MEQATFTVKMRHPSSDHHEAQSASLHLGNVLPRSRLYGLEPCEVGTIWGECLTSYLNRLIKYHLNFSGKEKPLIWLKRFCSEREGSHGEKEGTI